MGLVVRNWMFIVIAALAMTVVVFQNAHAEPVAAPGTANRPEKAATQDHDFVTDELFTTDGKLLSAHAFTKDGMEVPLPADYKPFNPATVRTEGAAITAPGMQFPGPIANGSGGGGSPGSSGCRAVTVNNEEESLLGFMLFWWHSQTYWCWSTPSFYIYNVSTTEWASDIDPVWEYIGITYDHEGYYAYLPGYSLTGYYNDKQAHFKSCIGPICQHQYPYNQLWSFYTGAYQWQTSG